MRPFFGLPGCLFGAVSVDKGEKCTVLVNFVWVMIARIQSFEYFCLAKKNKTGYII
jgi:hypothetical protein